MSPAPIGETQEEYGQAGKGRIAIPVLFLLLAVGGGVLGVIHHRAWFVLGALGWATTVLVWAHQRCDVVLRLGSEGFQVGLPSARGTRYAHFLWKDCSDFHARMLAYRGPSLCFEHRHASNPKAVRLRRAHGYGTIVPFVFEGDIRRIVRRMNLLRADATGAPINRSR